MTSRTKKLLEMARSVATPYNIINYPKLTRKKTSV